MHLSRNWYHFMPLLAGAVLALPLLTLAHTPQQKPPDDCDWSFDGSDRKWVKLRTVQQEQNYTKLGSEAAPLTLDQLYDTVKSFNDQVPQNLRTVPRSRPMSQLETVRVTVRAFLLGAKFERDGDKDFHAEMGASADWNTRHFVIEVPPGAAYCDARKATWELIKQDRLAHGQSPQTDRHIMNQPVEVLVTGYVFLDAFHGRTSNSRQFHEISGGRGLRKPGGGSKVKGIWEIHPVTQLKKWEGN